MEKKRAKKALEEQYLPIFMRMLGISDKEAKKVFKTLFARAWEEASAEDALKLPPNMGDILLSKEKSDARIREVLKNKRDEGVADEDIKWWWNRSELERRMMCKADDFFIYNLYLRYTKKEGLTQKQARKRIQKTRPLFGSGEDSSEYKGDDRPLPDELRNRVNAYFVKRGKKDPEAFKKEVEESTSFNAFARQKIKEGKL